MPLSLAAEAQALFLGRFPTNKAPIDVALWPHLGAHVQPPLFPRWYRHTGLNPGSIVTSTD
jgi:hypothetical protein